MTAKRFVITVLVLWFLVFSIGLILLSISPRHAHKDADTGRSPELTKEYDAINFKYFDGALSHVDVQVTDLKTSWVADTRRCGDRCYVITISDYWTPAPVEKDEALLHEVCHVYVESNGTQNFDVHGPAWQACMLTLATKGAFMARDANGTWEPIW